MAVVAWIPIATTCGGDRVSGPSGPGPATQIAAQAGDNQSATVGTSLAVAPSVIVRDARDVPVPGVVVTWAVASGGGSVSTASSTTGSGGTASANWTLGQAAGANALRAAAAGLTGSPVTFTANGVPGPASAAASLVSVSGNSLASGGSVTLTLQAKDAFGNNLTVGGATVVFTASGGTSTGTIGATTDNSNGTYSAIFTGVTAGTATTIRATIGGTAVTSALPTVTVTPGSISTSQSLVTVSSSTVASGSAVTLTLQAKDAAGNNLTTGGATVVFTASGGTSAGTIGSTTDRSNGTYTATFTGVAAGTATTIGATIGGTAVSGTLPTVTVTAGTASQLIFTTQPAGAVAGASFGVVVTARDAQGNTATGFTGSVTVAIGTNPGGGTLSGTLSQTASAGVATFSGLSIDKAGTGYTLTASATGPSSATSTTFTITAGTASALVFTTQPVSATAGASFGVVVTARDAQGNTATGFTGSVTVAIGTNPSGGTLSGTASQTASAGVATFSGLSIDKAGTGYTLTASATGPSSATSATFNITPGTAGTLVFTTEPVTTAAGASFGVVVTARDAQGNTATGFSGSVTVAIGTNPGGGTLSGTLSQTASAGVATFSGLSIDKAGTGYTLTASATGPSSATSTTFNITAGTASALVFTTQPISSTAGASFGVVVTARDAQGNTATGFTGSVTVAIGTNPGGGTLSGTASQTASAGVATFSGLSIDKSGTGYTLTASATGPSSATSAVFNITPGTASALVFTTQPTSSTAGASFGVVVTARDAQGNTATGFTGSVTVAIGTNPGSGTLSGTLSQTASAGVATFSGLSIDKSGTGYTLTASATGPSSATSAAFNITPGSASALVFTTEPTNSTAGASFGVVVTARDAQGNTATGFTGSVTVAIGTNPGGGTLSGTPSQTAVAGVATFSGLSIDKARTGYTLTASATGPSSATSTTFDITPGTASALVFTAEPTSSTAGASFGVVVTARDAQGNTATGFTGSVTVAIGTNPGSGTLSGTLSQAASAGVATFSGLSIDKSGTGYTLTASATGPSSATSTSFTITPGTAGTLVFTTEPATTTAGASFGVVVTARDAQGNTATGFTGSVTVAIGTNPGGGTLSGTLSQTAVAGVATFSGLSIDKAGTGYTLTASATGPSSATSAAFTITPGTASALVFTTEPVTTTAGVGFGVVVTARDAQGNTATGFTGSVTVAIGTNPGGGTLSGTLSQTASAGVATFSGLSIDKAGTGYTLTASATGPSSATSASFTITPGTASQLIFTTQPTGAVAGASFGVVVTARDGQGNTATGFTGSVTVAIGTNPGSGTLSGTLSQTASAGVATFSGLSIDKSGTGYTLTASATGPSSATSTTFTITPGTASQLIFTSGPVTTTAGASFGVVVTARDAQGNTATGFTGSVTVAIGTNPGGGTLSGTLSQSASAGVATFSGLSIDKAGTGYTLTASATGPSSATSAAFTITPGTAGTLVFTTQPTSSTAGASFGVVVTARDAQGNTATGFTGSVAVAIGTNPGGGTLSGTLSQTASAGVATFSGLSIDKAGTGYRLTASATGPSSATSTTFTITPGTASQLVFTTQPVSSTAGASFGVVVTARDAQGNTATGFTGSVTVAIGTNPGGGTLSGTLSQTASAGVATFSGLSIDKAGTGYTLTASATGPSSATSTTFNITPGTASQLVFTTQPVSSTAGASFGVVVTARDAQGNTATGFTASVTVAIGTNPGGGTLSGTPSQTAVAGVATFSGLSIDKSGTGYTLTASATGPSSATSASFTITPGTASQLVFTTEPTSSTAGASFGVVVTARDAQGNTATGFTGSVTVAIGTDPGGGTLSGTLNQTASAGVATFSGLSIDKSGTGYTLTASATGPSSATSTSFTITAGTASALVFTTEPLTTTAGASFGVVVTARDAQGNTATGFTASVTVAIGTNPGGGTLSGTPSQTAVAGVATFSGLSIDKAGTGYTLTASATGPSSATSAAFNITPGTASALVFTTQPVSATAGASFGVVVTARDAQGNTATGFTGSVTVAIGTNPGGGTLSGTLSQTASAGVATFTGLSIDKAGTGYTLTASATGPSSATSTSFTITPGTAGTLVFTTEPVTTTAGVGFGVVVTARDAEGNTATGFTGSVTVAIGTNPGGGTLSGTLSQTASAGVATFSGLSIDKAGTGYTLTASATGPSSATSAAFNITPGAASLATSTIAASSASITADGASTSTITVQLKDAQGNNLTASGGTVTLALTGTGTLSAVTNNSNGTYTATLTAPTAVGSASISASLDGSPLTHASNPVAVTYVPGAATTLALSGLTNAVAGTSQSLTVTARDAQGNTATGYLGTVHFTSTDGQAVLPADYDFVGGDAGVHTFSGVVLKTAGSQSVTGTDNVTGSITGTHAAVTISAGAAATLVLSGLTSAVAGTSQSLTVEARDAQGNRAIGYVGTVHFTSSDIQAVLPADYAFVGGDAGIHTFTSAVTLKTAGSQTVTGTDNVTGSITGTHAAVTISAGTAATLAFTTAPATTTAGTDLGVVVTARDMYGNTATSFTSGVDLAITGGTGKAGAHLLGTASQAAVAGVATFSALSIDSAGTGYTLTATATGPSTATSGSFDITPGSPSASRSTLSVSSGTVISANAVTLKLRARDAFGNYLTTGGATVIFTNSGGTSTGTISATADSATGVYTATFTGVLAGSATTIGATINTVTVTSTLPTITVTPNNATRFAFFVQPTNAATNTAINPAVVVKAVDDAGNVDTTWGGSGFSIGLEITSGTGNPSATLTGGDLIDAVKGVATFSSLTIDLAGTGYTLTAFALAVPPVPAGVNSTAFNIGP